ncbi:MAG: terpene cyclase/mutase family protein [Phycisphaerales bacterium]|nr:terpene cyclase/mutase family protein [Phycisphaerales bacterium]MCB9863864.1 terpene cyclase/mutase family protein [Phycisphaerales bacterium]
MYRCLLCAALIAFCPALASAEPTPMTTVPGTGPTLSAALSPELRQKAESSIVAGLKYLERQQDPDGGWSDSYRPAVTAIVARAFAQNKEYGPRHPVVRRAVEYILKFQQSDGGIYERENNLANYQTSVALTLLADLDLPEYKGQIARAQAFLTKLQFDDEESIDQDNNWYGGAGYNSAKRPDLSNTQMMLEALHESGLPADHPVYQKALTFVSRCQMNAATNDQPFASRGSDGGFIYSPNAGGESKASQGLFEIGTPRQSYGTMTYAGFKSMLYCGVERDDPRIKACLEWIRNNYTLEVNPGMPDRDSKDGLYYYYHVFARALHVWGEPTVVDAKGQEHNWRSDLCQELLSMQRKDGSWSNDARRWLESDSNYATALSVTSMQIALGK